jgi:hypothetical protein
MESRRGCREIKPLEIQQYKNASLKKAGVGSVEF